MTQWNAPDSDPYRQQPQGYQPGYGQPAYGQPGYGQPGYGQPGYGAPPAGDSFGIAGTVMALLGGILLIVAFTAIDWFGNPTLSFSDVGNGLDAAGDNANGFASAYFGWLAWLFLVVVVVAGVLSSVPTPALRAFRIIGTVVGFAAAGLSFLAVQLSDHNSYLYYLKHARVGFYFAVIGFLIAGIGAAIGPRRV
jgi:hypothetical protein